jgi:hypothetical protein
MSKNDGGPAFPATEYPMRVGTYDEEGSAIVRVSSPGMTLRDWFAGQNFAATFVNAGGLNSISAETLDEIFLEAARISYRGADAMLKAREQQ